MSMTTRSACGCTGVSLRRSALAVFLAAGSRHPLSPSATRGRLGRATSASHRLIALLFLVRGSPAGLSPAGTLSHLRHCGVCREQSAILAPHFGARSCCGEWFWSLLGLFVVLPVGIALADSCLRRAVWCWCARAIRADSQRQPRPSRFDSQQTGKKT